MSDQFAAIKDAFVRFGWFQFPGAYALVDGQFGSTGKGALATLIGALFGDKINIVTTNAGPNSGHVGYLPGGPESAKILTQQIPVAAAVAHVLFPRNPPLAYLNGGAVIDPRILANEALDYGFNYRNLWVHPNAAIIDPEYKDDVPSLKAIASTNKGVGQAIARKVLREDNVAKFRGGALGPLPRVGVLEWDWTKDVVLVETAQGFSLSINSGFFPFTTSRECTVMQAIADARIPVNRVRKTIMALRSYPIRVGNTAQGQSGGCYSDQKEIQWADIGAEPELTTVTKRVRRLFTWSRQQFREAVVANQPDVLFLNFFQYLKKPEQAPFVLRLLQDYWDVMGTNPEFLLLGNGPRPEDVELGMAYKVGPGE